MSLDTKELETRINQAFPGAQVKVRQVSAQIILDGQVPDSKMMADILQVVQNVVRFSGGIRMTGGGGMGGGTGAAMGGGGAGGAMGGMAVAWAAEALAARMGGAAAGIVIINRVVVPGPRQVLLHVKIAEINRQAIRQLGVSWLDTKGRSIIGSAIGGTGSVAGDFECDPLHVGRSPRFPLSP